MAIWLHNNFNTTFSLFWWSDLVLALPDGVGAAQADQAALLTIPGGIIGGLGPAQGICPASTHIGLCHLSRVAFHWPKVRYNDDKNNYYIW